MDLDKVYSDAKLLNNDYNKYSTKKDYKNLTYDEFVIKMNEKYDFLNKNCNGIYRQCIEGKMDLEILSYMVQQAKNVNKNKVSSHNAEVNVGQKLVDKLIKPIIEQNKNKNKI